MNKHDYREIAYSETYTNEKKAALNILCDAPG